MKLGRNLAVAYSLSREPSICSDEPAGVPFSITETQIDHWRLISPKPHRFCHTFNQAEGVAETTKELGLTPTLLLLWLMVTCQQETHHIAFVILFEPYRSQQS